MFRHLAKIISRYIPFIPQNKEEKHPPDVDINRINSDGETQLYLAAQNGNVELVKELLAKRAHLHTITGNGYTALAAATQNGHISIIKILLEAGADPNFGDNKPLHLAVKSKNLSSVNLLLEYKANPNQKVNGQSLLCLASSGDLEIVKTLLKAGANKSLLSCDSNCWSPLMRATHYGRLDIVRTLLDAGVDPDMTSRNGETAIYIAAVNGHLAIVKELLARQASLNIITEGYTALAAATQNDHAEIVKVLLEANADPNAGKMNSGIKPLSIAVHKKDLSLVNLFIEFKADINLRFNEGESNEQLVSKSLIGYAKENNLTEIVKVLAAANASHIPKGQRFLVDIRDEVNFTSAEDDHEGHALCSGVAATGMLYFFAKQLEKFDQLTDGVAKIKKDDFNNQFNDFVTYRRALIDKAKKELCQEIEREVGLKINPEEIWKFTTQAEQFPFVCDMLAKEDINPLPSSINHFNQLTEKQAEKLNNALRSVMGKKLQAKIALEEKRSDQSLEIRAFLEEIDCLQNPGSYPDLYEEKINQISQDPQLLLPILMPKELEEKGNVINQMDSFRGAYTKAGLYSYFDSLKWAIDKTQSSVCFVLLLCSSNHRVMVGFDLSHCPPWVLIDANHLPTRYLDSAAIPDKVLESLSDNGKTAFCTEIYACQSDKQEVMEIMNTWKKTRFWQKYHVLTETQGQTKIVDSYGGTLLLVASDYRDRLMVEELVKLKADVNQGLSEYIKPLWIAVVHNQDLPIVNALLKAGADPNIDYGKNEGTLLEFAVANDYAEIVKSLLKFKANPNVQSEVPLLFLAVIKGSLKMVDALLVAGADTSVIFQKTGDTLLNLASRLGHHEIVKRLLKFGLDPNIANFEKVYPLHRAISKNNIQLMRTLLEGGADPDCKLNNKYESIAYAISCKNQQQVRLLIAYGAATSIKQISEAEKLRDNMSIIDLLKYADKCHGDPMREKALRSCCALNLKSEDEFNQRFSEFKAFDTMAEKLRSLDIHHQYSKEINLAYQEYTNATRNAGSILLEFRKIRKQLTPLTIQNFWKKVAQQNTLDVQEEVLDQKNLNKMVEFK